MCCPSSGEGSPGVGLVGSVHREKDHAHKAVDRGRHVDPPQGENTRSTVNVCDLKVRNVAEVFSRISERVIMHLCERKRWNSTGNHAHRDSLSPCHGKKLRIA